MREAWYAKLLASTHGLEHEVFITLETAPMKQEAMVAGVYHSDVSGKDYPKAQILTIR